MSTPRIVLVDTLGDELFSGRSLLSTKPPPPHAIGIGDDGAGRANELRERSEEDLTEECPETLRSSVFVRVERASRIERTIEVTEADSQEAAPSGERAA
jgi:hypothetical protein